MHKRVRFSSPTLTTPKNLNKFKLCNFDWNIARTYQVEISKVIFQSSSISEIVEIESWIHVNVNTQYTFLLSLHLDFKSETRTAKKKSQKSSNFHVVQLPMRYSFIFTEANICIVLRGFLLLSLVCVISVIFSLVITGEWLIRGEQYNTNRVIKFIIEFFTVVMTRYIFRC